MQLLVELVSLDIDKAALDNLLGDSTVCVDALFYYFTLSYCFNIYFLMLF